MVKNLGLQNSLLSNIIAEIRDEIIQQDSMRFRKNLEKTGEIFAYEVSKELRYKNVEVQTPLGIANASVFDDTVLLATILRAGLPLHQGLLNFFDRAENAFISAYRKYEKDGSFDIKVEYISCPSTDDKVIIISDPMLATGTSMVLACKALLEKGKPRHIHIVTTIACTEGIDCVEKNLPYNNVTIWTGAVDEELTVKSYIVPGLGDAGDLAFGKKE